MGWGSGPLIHRRGLGTILSPSQPGFCHLQKGVNETASPTVTVNGIFVVGVRRAGLREALDRLWLLVSARETRAPCPPLNTAFWHFLFTVPTGRLASLFIKLLLRGRVRPPGRCHVSRARLRLIRKCELTHPAARGQLAKQMREAFSSGLEFHPPLPGVCGAGYLPTWFLPSSSSDESD